jgi:L-threonylcarbamoyladenylate synthase
MKYKHYAPNAKVTIISGERKKTIEKVKEMVHYNIENGKKVCILTVEENEKEYTEGINIVLGSVKNLSTVAKSLFEALRKCDDLGADLILAEGYEEVGVGIAIMNRLNKAAGFDTIKV